MPTLIFGATVRHGVLALVLRFVRRAILGSEDDVGVAAEDLLLAVSQQSLGAAVPGDDLAARVQREDREPDRALDNHPQRLVVERCRRCSGRHFGIRRQTSPPPWRKRGGASAG